MARRHFYVRELVENGEIVVPYVGTADNYADFFTKVLPPKKFEAMRDIIMNTDVPAFTRRADKSNCAPDWEGPLPDDDKYVAAVKSQNMRGG